MLQLFCPRGLVFVRQVGPYAPRRRLGLGDHLLVGRTGFSVNRYDYGISERMGAR